MRSEAEEGRLGGPGGSCGKLELPPPPKPGGPTGGGSLTWNRTTAISLFDLGRPRLLSSPAP